METTLEIPTSTGPQREADAIDAERSRSPRSSESGLSTISLADETRQVSAYVRKLVTNFQRDGDVESVRSLQGIRRELVQMLAPASDGEFRVVWQPEMAELVRLLLDSGIRHFPAPNRDQPLLESLEFIDEPTNGQLVARMLMAPSTRWPLPHTLREGPEPLLDLWLDDLFRPVEVHHEPGEADTAARHLVDLTDLVHKEVMQAIGGEANDWAIGLAKRYVTRMNVIQAYFCTDNLRPMLEQRGQLIALILVAAGVPVLHGMAPKMDRAPGTRLRIGVFAEHFAPQTESWFTLAHLDALDRTRFEIILYATRQTGHPLERLFVSRADYLKILPPNDITAQVALMRAERLDALLLATNSSAVTNQTALLAACRLAPLQISTVASPVTTGGTQVDVMLNASWNEPSIDAQQHHSEHLELMPGSVNFYAYQYDREPATVEASRQTLGIADDALLLFSGANFFKLVPEQTRTWIKVLQRLPRAVLVLMPFGPNWSNSYQRLPFMLRLHRELEEFGVSADRLRVVDPVPARADVHRIIALADIYLDPFPFSGACSLIDPLTVGVPAVVRRGSTGRSMHGASLLRLAGLEALICDDEESYIDTVVSLGTDPAKRRWATETLSRAKSQDPAPWADTAGFSRRVGATLERLITEHSEHYRRLELMRSEQLAASLQRQADLCRQRSPGLILLTDSALVSSLVMPYFESLGTDCAKRLLDVGACYGSISAPFLAAGWTAELFEPDPHASAIARTKLQPWAGRWRLHEVAVSDVAAAEVSFHKSRIDGLSGLATSPFCETDQIIRVPCVRLDQFFASQSEKRVDLVKIDAEGFDFDVLRSIDLDAQQPRLIMLEYGTHFARQGIDEIRAEIDRMAGLGWECVVFDCREQNQFAQGRWIHRLERVILGAVTVIEDLGFGNIVFYRREDNKFLLALAAMLQGGSAVGEIWSGGNHPAVS